MIVLKPISVLLALLLLCGIHLLPLSAQERLEVEHWDIDDGLADRDVLFTTRGPAGFLWTVTSNVQMYDGHRFTLFSQFDREHYLPLLDPVGALQYSDSVLLLANAEELCAFNMNSRTATPWPFPEGTGLQQERVMAITRRPRYPDIMIISKRSGQNMIYLISKDWKKRLEVMLPGNVDVKKSRITNGPPGTFWLSRPSDRMITKHSPAGTDTIAFDFRGFDGFSTDSYLLYHPQHGLLVMLNNGLVYQYDEKVATWQLIIEEELPKDRILDVRLEASGKLRITCSEKLLIVDLDQRQRRIIQQSLLPKPYTYINYVSEDKEGNTWYATRIGLFKVNKSGNPFLANLRSTVPGINRQFREIFPLPDGQSVGARFFAVAHQTWLGVIDRQGLSLETPELLSEATLNGRYVRDGELLWTIKSGTKELQKINMSTWETTTTSLPEKADRYFHNQFLIQGHRIHYSNASNDITVFDLTDSSSYTVSLQGREWFGHSFDQFLVLDHGRYIRGWGNAGLTVHDAETGALLHHYSTETSPSLTSNRLNCLVMNGPDSLWVGTLGGGLMLIDLAANKVQHYTTANGLTNNMVASLIEDDIGNLWIGTYYGLNRLDRRTGTFSSYFEADGLPDNEFNYLASYKDPHGNIYLGTINGFVKFNPVTLLAPDTLPPVLLTAIQRYNRRQEQLLRQELSLDRTERVVVSPYDNFVEFEFAVPSFKRTGRFSYAVKMEGLDAEWQELGKAHSIRYRKLPAGTYAFLVQARDANGVASPVSRPLQVVVRNFYYNTWWFQLLVASLIVILFWLFYRYRIRLLQKEAETRIRISQDLHDELGSSMTRISMLMQMMESHLPASQRPLLSKLERLMDQAISQLRDLVWAVDKSSDRWSEVLTRMEHYAYDTLRPKEILFSLQTESIDVQQLLSPVDKRNLYLIFKEAVNNIAKHADAQHVMVCLRNSTSRFSLLIEDDGRSNGTLNKGHGLNNLRQRAERMGGTLTYGFGEDRGFKVHLQLPRRL